MIAVEQLATLDGSDLEDVLDLVRYAWAYDEEAGFTRITEDLVRLADGVENELVIRHLLVRGRLDDPTWDGDGGDLLAYLHLSVEGSEGYLGLVVHPDHRSRGVSTLTVETLGLDTAAGGWLGTGAHAVRGWAYGHHPAAERLARRFALARLSQTWLQVRQLTGPHALPLPTSGLPAGVRAEPLDGPLDAERLRECRPVLAAGGVSRGAEQQLSAGLRTGGIGGLLARDPDGVPVGLVLADVDLGSFDARPATVIRSVAVVPGRQGGGVGLGLLTDALRAGTGRGAELALLRIDPTSGRAVRLVRRLGFERNQDDALYGFGDVYAENQALPE